MSFFGQSAGASPFGAPSFSTPAGSIFGSSAAAGGSFFGAPSATPAAGSLFGAPGGSSGASPASSIFGAPGGASSGGAGSSFFGAASRPGSSPSLFGAAAPSSTPAWQTSLFGAAQPSQPQTSSLFGQSQPSIFGQAQPSTSLFGQPQGSTSLFGQSQPSTSLFGQPQASTSLFGQSQASMFGTPGQQQQYPAFGGAQLQTQMAPMAPLAAPLPEREVSAIVEAYRDDPFNPNYRFRHLLLSVTPPEARTRPAGASELAWAAALRQLEGLDGADRARLWPELAQGFKDLSRRLRLQDEALSSDEERLRATESNVRQLARHFEADTVPRAERLRQREQDLQRRLLRVMRIVEALEKRGLRIPLNRDEVRLAERLRSIAAQIQGSSLDLARRANAVHSAARLRATAQGGGLGGGAAGVDELSLEDMHQVLEQQTQAIERLTGVLKQDARDAEIMFAEHALEGIHGRQHGGDRDSVLGAGSPGLGLKGLYGTRSLSGVGQGFGGLYR